MRCQSAGKRTEDVRKDLLFVCSLRLILGKLLRARFDGLNCANGHRAESRPFTPQG